MSQAMARVGQVQQVLVQAVDGVVDLATTSIPNNYAVEIELAGAADIVTMLNVHVLQSTHITIGSSLSFSLAGPIELPLSTLAYTGPVIDKMVLPPGLKSVVIVETPKSVIVSKVKLPLALEALELHMTETFSPVDQLDLPPGLMSLKIFGEHNCSLELLGIPPALQHLDLGSSVQPVDRLRANLLDMSLKSRSTRLVEVGDNAPPNTFQQTTTLSSSTPILTEIHKFLPKLANVNVILDSTMWATVGDIWCKALLEGRVRVNNLTIVNNMHKKCMGDFGEVMYRSRRLGRPLCRHLRVMGEVFDYATLLQITESVRTLPFSFRLDVDFNGQFPMGAFHRAASVLGALHRDGEQAYHSKETNVSFEADDNRVVFVKSVREVADDISDNSDNTLDEADLEGGDVSSDGLKPVTLYSWNDCAFCREQESIVADILQSDMAEKFIKHVTVNNVDNPADARDKGVTSFPTWVIGGTLSPGLKQKDEILGMLNTL